MPYITHRNGQTTHYLDDNFTDPWNTHETILIQHGFARSAAFWYHWVPILSRHYRVIRRDARGHGLSSTPPEDYDYSVDEILLEIIDTLDQIGVRKVHFLGESTGGIFGEALAAKYPDRVLSLTVCSSPMFLPAEQQDMLAFGHSIWPAACRALGSKGWAVEASKLLGTDKHLDRYYVRWWIEQVAVADGKGLGDHAEMLSKIDAREFVGQIKAPMLILAPSNSKMVPMTASKELQSKVPGSKLVVVEGTGHEIYVDQAEQCQKAFLQFLEDVRETHTPIARLRRYSSISME
jgi:pimeloyl-ACP methyl ester carboxylesterase